MTTAPLAGFRIGVTASRRATEQAALLERRGAEVVHAPALAEDSRDIDRDTLDRTTRAVLAEPIDLFLATTGIGVRAWFAAAEEAGLAEELTAHLATAEILARGPKSVGALRQRGLREAWSPASEAFEDVLDRVRQRDLNGLRIVIQEHGQSLATAAEELRARGAEVTTVALYRVRAAADPDPVADLVHRIAEWDIDAVTFTAAPAVTTLLDAAVALERRDEVVAAFRQFVLAVAVGPVTAAAFEPWDIPSTYPDRSRLAAMVTQVERALPAHRRRFPRSGSTEPGAGGTGC